MKKGTRVQIQYHDNIRREARIENFKEHTLIVCFLSDLEAGNHDVSFVLWKDIKSIGEIE